MPDSTTFSPFPHHTRNGHAPTVEGMSMDTPDPTPDDTGFTPGPHPLQGPLAAWAALEDFPLAEQVQLIITTYAKEQWTEEALFRTLLEGWRTDPLLKLKIKDAYL